MHRKFKELWVEKYRPKKIDDYIFENETHKVAFQTFIKEKSIPHLLLTGIQGSGKSTISQILIDSMNVDEADILTINASDENSVDIMREKINSFVMSYAFGDGTKIVLLEEADYITPNGQAVMRRLMEEYVDEARFILTGNYENKIKEPIKSRCQHFRFKAADPDDIAEYVANILVSEEIDFDLEQLDLYVAASYPDIRKIVNSIQQSIDDDSLMDIAAKAATSTEDFRITLMGHITNDDWIKARQVVCGHASNQEIEEIYTFLYKNLDKSKKFSKQDKWEAGQLKIAEYLYTHSMVADPEINLAALFIELKQV